MLATFQLPLIRRPDYARLSVSSDIDSGIDSDIYSDMVQDGRSKTILIIAEDSQRWHTGESP